MRERVRGDGKCGGGGDEYGVERSTRIRVLTLMLRRQESTETPPKVPRHPSDGQATKNSSKMEPRRDQKRAPKHAQHKYDKMSQNHVIYNVLYTSGHPWDHQFSTILGTKMQSKRCSKQICQKSCGNWFQSLTRPAQRSAKVP